jgi:ribonuclease HII
MRGFSKRYPRFGFEKNKGYGTKEHIHAIGLYGPTPFHRLTFKPLLNKIKKNVLMDWLEYGQISSLRYEMILSKINKQFSQQKQLSGFFR